MIWIVLAAAALVLLWALGRADKCPREILGYRCKGDACDHSRLEVARAERAMGKGNRWL